MSLRGMTNKFLAFMIMSIGLLALLFTFATIVQVILKLVIWAWT